MKREHVISKISLEAHTICPTASIFYAIHYHAVVDGDEVELIYAELQVGKAQRESLNIEDKPSNKMFLAAIREHARNEAANRGGQ